MEKQFVISQKVFQGLNKYDPYSGRWQLGIKVAYIILCPETNKQVVLEQSTPGFYNIDRHPEKWSSNVDEIIDSMKDDLEKQHTGYLDRLEALRQKHATKKEEVDKDGISAEKPSSDKESDAGKKEDDNEKAVKDNEVGAGTT